MNYFTFPPNKQKKYGIYRRPYLVRIEVCILPKEKEVRKIRYYGNQSTGYCVCPGCKCTFEREYQSYCDRCGQKLAWNLYSLGNVTLVKRIPCSVKRTEELNKEIELSKAAIL